MKHTILLLLCALSLACASTDEPSNTSQAQTNPHAVVDLGKQITSEHPSRYFALAAKLFQEGEEQQAAKWLYVGLMRYQTFINSGAHESEFEQLTSLWDSIGAPINEHLGGNIDEAMATINEAILWHENNPDHFLGIGRSGLQNSRESNEYRDLIAYIDSERDNIQAKRAENGLENR
uniref:hypothetical protein n=1 Tax=Thaumasiovibrio occultus TaxID=1891184 RepID=UPI000B34B752|nr:hypothetical protein [Thaumasiovibrio occultus]